LGGGAETRADIVVGGRDARMREPRLAMGTALPANGGLARPHVTTREREVLELLASGLSTERISAQMWISPQAVSYHLGNLYAKFGCENRAGLVSRAFVSGMLSVKTWPPRSSGTVGRPDLDRRVPHRAERKPVART
jgi:DNA-binding CsgD family transcriptional regulator